MGANADGSPAADVPAPAAFEVGPAAPPDASRAASLHAQGIGEGFLSALGPAFLSRLYLRIAREPGCFLLVARSRPDGAGGPEVAGFVAGAAEVRRLYRSFLVHDGVRAALPVAGRLLRSLPRVAETLRHGTSADAGSGRGTELLAIAVDPAWRGAGVGGALVAAFLDEVRARGGDAAHVVVAADNEAAVRLYRRAGFTEAGRFELHRGRASLLLQWEAAAGGDRP